jgi:hypothetical protein
MKKFKLPFIGDAVWLDISSLSCYRFHLRISLERDVEKMIDEYKERKTTRNMVC